MFSIRINHLTVIIIEFVHDSKITISNTNNNDRNRESVTRNDQVNGFLSIMDLAISDYKKNHVLVVCFLELF